ncbi:helix-turn-helix domain-containing protein [Oceanobacillus sp. HCA-5259]
MSKRRSKHTLQERIDAILRVIKSGTSVSTIAKEYSVDRTTILSTSV